MNIIQMELQDYLLFNYCIFLASECSLAKKPRCDFAQINGNLKLRNALRGCKPYFEGREF